MSVKTRVLQLCEEHGVRPGTLEREIKLSSGTISRWNDKSFPNSQTLAAIADFFGVTTDWILEREPDFISKQKCIKYAHRKSINNISDLYNIIHAF